MQNYETARQKRLDELFADEPHLSPTMKARRLHEKLAQTGSPSAFPNIPSGAEGFSLQQARAVLQNGAGAADARTLRLFRFRETRLDAWLAELPENLRGPQETGRRNTS